MFSSSADLSAEIFSAFFHAKVRAEIITQAITARARSQLITVIAVTATITKASLFGILFIIFSVGHAKVPITTININQTSAASGISEMYFVANTIRIMRKTEAEIPDILHLHPFDILIIDCQIIAHHPMAQKKPQTLFAIHCPTASLLFCPLVSVISSIRVSVISDSVRPITASISEYGSMIFKVSNNQVSNTGI